MLDIFPINYNLQQHYREIRKAETETDVDAAVIRNPDFYRPQRSCGQGYVFTRVCDCVHMRVSTSVHAGIPARTPPPPPPPLGSTHPPPREADSGIRSMSGRYASYWNAFLLHGGFVIRQFSGHLFDQACSTGEKL